MYIYIYISLSFSLSSYFSVYVNSLICTNSFPFFAFSCIEGRGYLTVMLDHVYPRNDREARKIVHACRQHGLDDLGGPTII